MGIRRRGRHRAGLPGEVGGCDAEDEVFEARVVVVEGRSAEDGGAELVRVAVRDAEADLRLVDDGDGDEIEGNAVGDGVILVDDEELVDEDEGEGCSGRGCQGELAEVEAGEVACSGKEVGVVGVAGDGAGEGGRRWGRSRGRPGT